MIRVGLLGVCLLAVSVVAEPRPPLIVMTDIWPPFRMLDEQGELVGLDIDLLEQLSLRTGLQFEVRRAPWARGLAALQQGKADLMTGLAKTPEREQYIEYLPSPYHVCSPRFYVAPAQAQALRDYAQLARLKIGYVLESAYFEPFDSDSQLRKVAVSNEQQLLEMLMRGRLQAIIGTDCQVDYALRDFRWHGHIAKAEFTPPAHTDLYVGFSRLRVRAPDYQLLSQALHELAREGWVAAAMRAYQAASP